jgi:hypothetical protein
VTGQGGAKNPQKQDHIARSQVCKKKLDIKGGIPPWAGCADIGETTRIFCYKYPNLLLQIPESFVTNRPESFVTNKHILKNYLPLQ